MSQGGEVGAQGEVDAIETAVKRHKRRNKLPEGSIKGTWQDIRQTLRLTSMSGATFRGSLPNVNGRSDISVRVDSQDPRRYILSF